MNRWPLASTDQIGRVNPAVSATERIRKLNPHVEVVVVPEFVTAENVRRLVAQADIVVDGAPYFEERHLLNRECVQQKKPMVEAAAEEGVDIVVISEAHDDDSHRRIHEEARAVYEGRSAAVGPVERSGIRMAGSGRTPGVIQTGAFTVRPL